MLLDISDLEASGLRIDENLGNLDLEHADGSQVHCRAIRTSGRLLQIQGGVEFQARFGCLADFECCRCLDRFERHLEQDFRLLFLPNSSDARAAVRDADEDAGGDRFAGVDHYPLEGHTVELEAVIEEQINLAFPLKVLCSESCRGLCPGCGSALDREECRCSKNDVDPTTIRE